MTDLNYYGAIPRLPHRGGLIAWGIVVIAFGAIMALSCLFTAAMATILAVRHAGDVQLEVALYCQSFTTACISVGLIWLGIGCCQGRRWVGPLMVAGGALTIGLGVASLVQVAVAVVRLLQAQPTTGAGAAPGGQAFAAVSMAFGAMGTSIVFIGVPVGILAWFNRPTVNETLAYLDPVPRWTDGVPLTRLAWVLLCLLVAVGAVVQAVSGMSYAFTTLLSGWPSVIVGLPVGLALLVAGVGSYRRSGTAWLAGIAVFALLAASAGTFAVIGDQQAYHDQIVRRTEAMTHLFGGRPARNGAATPNGAEWVSQINPAVSPAIICAAAALFGLWARRSIVPAPEESA